MLALLPVVGRARTSETRQGMSEPWAGRSSRYGHGEARPPLLTGKGLPMYYQGKSQSFACMSELWSLEDLQKKEKPRKMKPCKSYATLGGMASNKPAAASSCANLGLMAAGNGFRGAPRNIPVNEHCYHQ